MPGCAPTTITANPRAVPCSQPGPRRPLNATTPGDYEWALVHRTGMEASIGDAAEQLARHDLDQHNPTQATWAAPAYSPAPTTNRSTASSCAPPIPPATPPATPAGVDTIMRELPHILDAEDQPLDDLHPDTIALYKKLLSTRALRT